MERIKNNKKILCVVAVCLMALLWTQREIIIYNTGVGYRILEILFTGCMLLILTWTIYFLFIETDQKVSNKEFYTGYLLLFLVQLVAFLPLYTQNFLYGDDLWGFASEFDGSLDTGLYFSRPFISFVYGILENTSFVYIKYFRICNGMVLSLFGCILFRYVTIEMRNKRIAFLFSAIAVASCSAVDCIAYASVYPINVSLMISAISFIIYLKARHAKGRDRWLLVAASGICLVSAFCFYQIGTPIVFLLYVIADKCGENKKEGKRFRQAFAFMIYYGSCAISYLCLTKILQWITGVSGGQGARGQIILSLDVMIQKMKWFIDNVCPQAFTRIIGAIGGNSLFKENNMFYQCTYTNSSVEIISMLFFITLILCSIIGTAIKNKSYVYVFLSLCAIPLSFWPFLVLPESVFLTYYSMGLILLFLWYICDGAFGCLGFIAQRIAIIKKIVERRKNEVIGIIVFIVVLQSNNYAENAWVNYCRDSYEYLANTIASELNHNEEIDTIAVKGSISPYVGGRDYVIFSVENILKELGYDSKEYHIVQSDNGYFLLTFGDDEVKDMQEALGEEKFDQLIYYYMHDDMYGRWCYNGKIKEQIEMEFLKECFKVTNQIPVEDSETIVIDMTGFNARNAF